MVSSIRSSKDAIVTGLPYQYGVAIAILSNRDSIKRASYISYMK